MDSGKYVVESRQLNVTDNRYQIQQQQAAATAVSIDFTT